MWKVGDRVVIIQDARRPLTSFVGFKGTVNFVDGHGGMHVVFDKYVNGHDLGGSCQDGHGWYLFTRGENENEAEANGMRVKKINNRKNNYW
mgnify:CR=1 FL=1|jgi:hypothetical protein